MAVYALIGKNINHSQSPLIHSIIGNCRYDIIDIPSYKLLPEVMANSEYDGFNITSPYKNDIIKYLDDLDETARKIQSVNVVKREKNGKLKGYNTDAAGFGYMLESRVIGKKCAVLGTGGAAVAVRESLLENGARDVILISREPDNSDKRKCCNECQIAGYDEKQKYEDCEIIVNATPVGQYPHLDSIPLRMTYNGKRLFNHLELAIDLIYNPYRTRFLQDAKRINGCIVINGIEMLIAQALLSNLIWFSDNEDDIKISCTNFESIDRDKIVSIKEKIIRKQMNIVAVGMPGSGKTTIFRRYAREQNLKFVDIDAITEKLLGMPIADMITSSDDGEEKIRVAECDAVKDISLLNGNVIATGGGTIINPINRDFLRSNGIVVYMKRPIELLSTRNRPLSKKLGTRYIFNKRKRIYKKVSDLQIINAEVFGKQEGKLNKKNTYNYRFGRYVLYMISKIDEHIKYMSESRTV